MALRSVVLAAALGFAAGTTPVATTQLNVVSGRAHERLLTDQQQRAPKRKAIAIRPKVQEERQALRVVAEQAQAEKVKALQHKDAEIRLQNTAQSKAQSEAKRKAEKRRPKRHAEAKEATEKKATLEAHEKVRRQAHAGRPKGRQQAGLDKQGGVAPHVRSQTVRRSASALRRACTLPPGMRKVTVRGGFEMVVLGDNDIVSKQISERGYWEIHSADDMAGRESGRLPERGVFLDIGANLGYYSLLFAKKGYNVIAVEPMTRNRQAIEASLCLNPELRDRVTLVPVALVAPEEVDATRCKIQSTNYQVNIGNGFLTCGDAARVSPCNAFDKNCENVQVRTLDMVLSELGPVAVDAVKMDVENYECHVFRGGQSLFSKYQPSVVQVETEWGRTRECVNDEAQRHRYQLIGRGENTVMARV